MSTPTPTGDTSSRWGVEHPTDVSARNTRMMILIADRIWGIASSWLLERTGITGRLKSLQRLLDENIWVPLWVFVAIAEEIHDMILPFEHDEQSGVTYDPRIFKQLGGYAVRFQEWGKRFTNIAKILTAVLPPIVGYLAVPRENLKFNHNKSYGLIRWGARFWQVSYEVSGELLADRTARLIADGCSDPWIQGLWEDIVTLFGFSEKAEVTMHTRSFDALAYFSGYTTDETTWAPTPKRLRAMELNPEVTEEGVLLLRDGVVAERVYVNPEQGQDGLFYLTGKNCTPSTVLLLARRPHWHAIRTVAVGAVTVLQQDEIIQAHILTRRIRHAEIGAGRLIKTMMTADGLMIDGVVAARLTYQELPRAELPTGFLFTADVAPEHPDIILAHRGEVWGADFGFTATVTWKATWWQFWRWPRRLWGVLMILLGSVERTEQRAAKTYGHDVEHQVHLREKKEYERRIADLAKQGGMLEARDGFFVRMLGEYLPPRLITRIMAQFEAAAETGGTWDDISAFPPFEVEATVLVCDLVNSTGWTSVLGHDPLLLTKFINRCFAIAEQYNAWPKDLLGDGVVLVFSDFAESDNGAFDAVDASLQIREFVRAERLTGVRIGIATGRLTIHPAGKARADFSGDPGVIAARLEALDRSQRTLISRGTAQKLGVNPTVPFRSEMLKGVTFEYVELPE